MAMTVFDIKPVVGVIMASSVCPFGLRRSVSNSNSFVASPPACTGRPFSHRNHRSNLEVVKDGWTRKW